MKQLISLCDFDCTTYNTEKVSSSTYFMFLKSFQMYVENSKNAYLMLIAESRSIMKKVKTAEEKCPKGLDIFIVYFELKCFEYNIWFSWAVIYLLSSLFDHFSNLEITVLLSPSSTFFVQSLMMESLMCFKHFDLRKSQIMINCVLGKLKSYLAIWTCL